MFKKMECHYLLATGEILTGGVAKAKEEITWNHNEIKEYYYDINANWLGIGYNLVYLDPEDFAAPAFEKPNLSVPPVVFQLERGDKTGTTINGTTIMIPKGVDFTSGNVVGKFDSELKEIKSGNDYREEMRGSLEVSGGAKGMFSASGSSKFKNVQQDTTNSEKRIWQIKGEVTGHKLAIQLDRPKDLTLSERFRSAIGALTSPASYKKFIDTWGTHFASTVAYGGKAYYRLEETKGFFKENHLTELDFAAAVEGTFKGITASVSASGGGTTERTKTEENLFQKIRAISYGGDGTVIERNINEFNEWAKSVRDNLTVIGLKLTAYDKLLTKDFFPDDPKISEKRNNLQKAISDYLKKNEKNAPVEGDFYEYADIGSCLMYQNGNFGGKVLPLAKGDSSGFFTKEWNDQVSSIKVPDGCALTVYENNNYGGSSRTYPSGKHKWVGDGWNDKISSAKCSCTKLYQIEALNKCLEVAYDKQTGMNKKGRKVRGWECHGGENQQWEIKGGQGNQIIMQHKDGKEWCLDIDRDHKTGPNKVGREVIAWPCSGGENQKWGSGSNPLIRRFPSICRS